MLLWLQTVSTIEPTSPAQMGTCLGTHAGLARATQHFFTTAAHMRVLWDTA